MCFMLSAAAVLLPAGSAAAVVSDTEQGKAETDMAENAGLSGKVCRETRYMGLWQDNMFTGRGDSSLDYYRLYDSEGNYAGQTVYAAAVGYLHGFLEKGGMYSYTLDRVKYLQDTTSLEILAQVPEEDGLLETGKSLYCILRYQEGVLEVYNAGGELLCRFSPDRLPSCIPEIRENVENYNRPLSIIEAENAALVSLSVPSGSFGILLRSDGSIMTSDEAGFPEAFLQSGFRTHLGSFFLREYSSEENGVIQYEVYTEEGTLLMKGMQISYNGSFDSLQIREHSTSDRGINYIYRPDRDSENYEVYDASLRMVSLYSGTYMRDYDGFSEGIPCDELGGRKPDGMAEYCSERMLPWVRTEYGCDIWNGERQIRMLLPPAEIPVQFNDGLVYTKEEKESLTADGKKSIVYHLRKISEVPEACPGEDMADPAWRGPDVWLEKGSFAVPGNSWAGETSSIYDMEGTLLFSTHGRLIKSVDGNYYLRRGAFSGIIDCRGNWLIREYYGRE